MCDRLMVPRRIYFFDVCVIDTVASLYEGRHHTHILSQKKRLKKGKYPEALLEIQHHFIMIMVSVDCILG